MWSRKSLSTIPFHVNCSQTNQDKNKCFYFQIHLVCVCLALLVGGALEMGVTVTRISFPILEGSVKYLCESASCLSLLLPQTNNSPCKLTNIEQSSFAAILTIP